MTREEVACREVKISRSREKELQQGGWLHRIWLNDNVGALNKTDEETGELLTWSLKVDENLHCYLFRDATEAMLFKLTWGGQ